MNLATTLHAILVFALLFPGLAIGWSYDEYADEMGRGTTNTASVFSNNEIDFGFPYGRQRMMLMLRKHPTFGKNVILQIRSGQFLCRRDSCSVTVKFDDGKLQKFSADEAADYSSNTIFISNYSRFLGALKKSRKLLIEADFYRYSGQVFVFDINGLNWKN